MKGIIKDYYRGKLAEIFLPEDVDVVLDWFQQTRRRKPLVVVGAGFTLNSKNEKGNSATNWPMWSGLTDMVKEQLGMSLDGGQQDALFLSELFKEMKGQAEYSRAFWEFFDDSQLSPGESHIALFKYPAAGIVTTNLLDRVLDFGLANRMEWPGEHRSEIERLERNWVRVVEDADLAKANHDYPPQIELVYLHGHRDHAKTWILTRSEYEDLHITRPAIVTRVRQLVSQHPLLLVGYSLRDPDFHQLYREVGRELDNSQPRGIAIVVSKPNPHEKEHWKKLGIDLVTLQIGPSCDESLGAFFKLNPDWSVQIEELVTRISDENSFEARVLLSREFLSNEDPEAFGAEVISTSSRYKIWRTSALGSGLYEEDELKFIKFGNSGSAHDVAFGSGKESTNRGLKHLPEEFSVGVLEFRLVDALLEADTDPILVAEWLGQGLKLVETVRGFPNEFYLPSMLEVLIWLWNQAIGTQNSGPGLKNAYQHVARDFSIAHRVAEQFNLEQVLGQLKSLNELAGIATERSEESDPEAGEYSGQLDQFRSSSKLAFFSALDGDHENASRNYAAAAVEAAKANSPVDEWLSLRGAIQYIRRRDLTDSPEKKSLKERLTRIEDHPDVSAWREVADSRLKEANKTLLDSNILNRNKRRWGKDTIAHSNSFHLLWRTIRDLEVRYAPPLMIPEFLKPLLSEETFEPFEELDFRLRYGIKSTSDALEDYASSLTGRGSEPTTARKLVDLVWDTEQLSTTEHLARLKATPGLAPLVQVGQESMGPTYLKFCRQRLGLRCRTFNSDNNLFADYAQAWRSVLSLQPFETAISELQDFSQTVDNTIEISQLSREINNLPWPSWAKKRGQGKKSANLLAGIIVRHLQNEASFDDLSGIVSALNWISQTTGNLAFNKTVSAKLKSALASNVEQPMSNDWNSQSEAIELLLRIDSGYVDTAINFLDVALMKETDKSDGFRIYDEILLCCSLAISFHEVVNPNLFEQSDVFSRVVDKILSAEDRFKNMLPLNTHMSYPVCFFLNSALPHLTEADRERSISLLLWLVKKNPDLLFTLGRSARPESWGGRWTELLAEISRFGWGPLTSNWIEHRAATIKLCSNLAPESKKALFEELPELAQVPVSQANSELPRLSIMSLRALRHISGHLPNHAVRSAVAALEAASKDPRTRVRAACAGAVADLIENRKVDFSEQIIDVKRRLEADTFALVRTEIRLARN